MPPSSGSYSYLLRVPFGISTTHTSGSVSPGSVNSSVMLLILPHPRALAGPTAPAQTKTALHPDPGEHPAIGGVRASTAYPAGARPNPPAVIRSACAERAAGGG